MKKIAPFILIAFLSGCANHSALELFKKDELFESAILQTKKADIISSFETKAIINATYLNPIDKDFKSNESETFLIGIYITDDNKSDNANFLKNPTFKLSLNDKEVVSFKEIESTHKMYSHIPLKNSWAKYYEVKFPRDAKETLLILKYEHQTFGHALIAFESDYQ